MFEPDENEEEKDHSIGFCYGKFGRAPIDEDSVIIVKRHYDVNGNRAEPKTFSIGDLLDCIKLSEYLSEKNGELNCQLEKARSVSSIQLEKEIGANRDLRNDIRLHNIKVDHIAHAIANMKPNNKQPAIDKISKIIK